jgi:hypothetical protein
MKTKSIITNVALALTLGMFYTSCDKTKDDTIDTDTSSASDNSTSENAFSDMFKSVKEVSDGNASLRTTTCATITVDTTPVTTWPKTITIDYGTGAGCSGKKGKIKAVLTGHFLNFGTLITITTDSNYCYGAYKINAGTHTILNNGGNLAGHKTFSISVSSAALNGPGGIIAWSSTRTIEWIAGDSTLTTADDVYLISGQTTGTSAKGITFTSTITTPLRIATSCQWIESGVVSLTPKNKKTRVIDFGTTGCDNNATVTINGKVYNVTM